MRKGHLGLRLRGLAHGKIGMRSFAGRGLGLLLNLSEEAILDSSLASG